MNSEKPNVLIFLIDSQGVDNLSCYGYHRKTSPNIDKIAADGVCFLNNFTPCAWTPPSHASIMTGRYLSGHMTLNLGLRRTLMPKDIPTIAETLNAIGYKTAAFTVNMLVNNEEGGVLRGFKEVFYPSLMRRREKEAAIKALFEEAGEPEGRDKGSLYTVHLTKKWIEKNYDGKKPFFIFINVLEPHIPYWPGEPFRSRFLPPGVTEERAKKIPQMNSHQAWRREYPWRHVEKGDEGEFGYPRNPEDWMIMKALLDGETAQVDHRIGLLIEYLNEKGLYDDTLIMVTADHHDVLWEHKGKTHPNGHIEYTGHTSLYDANIHIPLVVKGYSEDFPPGTYVKNMTDLTDIFSTLIDVLKIEDEKVKKSVQGYSLLSALHENPPRKFIIAEKWNPSIGLFCRSWVKAIRNLEYKYIWRSTGEEELYNVAEDPYEQENIISKMPEKSKTLQKNLERFLLSIEIPPIHLKKEAIKWMKAWGYHRQIIPAD